MIPRLQAEEAIQTVNRVVMARQSKLERSEARKIRRAWEKAAFPKTPQPATAMNVWGGLAEGIKVVLVPTDAKKTDG